MERAIKTRAQPPELIKLETRLNKHLSQVNTRLIDKLIEGVGLQGDPYPEEIRGLYNKHFQGVATYGRDGVIRTLRAKTTPQVIPEAKLQRLIDNRTFRASDFTLERLRGEIFPAIERGILEGQTLETTRADLRTQFQGMADWQLMRISRTETQSTYNESKFETMNNSNVVRGKTWLASGLENMRPSHEALNGETVAMEETFSNGLMFPGDPDGPPEEIINCACTLIPNIRFNGG